MNELDHVTHQNAAMVEETTAASYALAGEADEPAGLVAKFRLSSDAGQGAAAAFPEPGVRTLQAKARAFAEQGARSGRKGEAART